MKKVFIPASLILITSSMDLDSPIVKKTKAQSEAFETYLQLDFSKGTFGINASAIEFAFRRTSNQKLSAKTKRLIKETKQTIDTNRLQKRIMDLHARIILKSEEIGKPVSEIISEDVVLALRHFSIAMFSPRKFFEGKDISWLKNFLVGENNNLTDNKTYLIDLIFEIREQAAERLALVAE